MFDIRLSSDLSRDPIVTQAPIRRRSDNGSKQPFRQTTKNQTRITHYDLASILGEFESLTH
jgi:hypothetical protein